MRRLERRARPQGASPTPGPEKTDPGAGQGVVGRDSCGLLGHLAPGATPTAGVALQPFTVLLDRRQV